MKKIAVEKFPHQPESSAVDLTAETTLDFTSKGAWLHQFDENGRIKLPTPFLTNEELHLLAQEVQRRQA